ncbi:hypothetical protein [Kitasatospora sp. DSM 101779]|uniref:hypothetical protein n=1 Tax=Kitasatospora sp. DSM 101779 TaxID=2853165 RepID=UPI0021D871B4|nr:hypothetical protein [Kitasatospora sp. DSM 101779]MCU7823225.1 hypothetical protein [Kitasatospora sp. DSM 101779]
MAGASEGMRATKQVLPTARVHPPNAIKLANAVVDLSGENIEPVKIENAADRVGMSRQHAAMVPRFMISCDLMMAADGGKYAPTTGLLRFCRLWRQGGDRQPAREALGEILGRMWFATEARSLLTSGPRPVEDLTERLRLAAGVDTNKNSAVALAYLVEWMIIANLVQRDEKGRIVLPLPARESPNEEPMNTAGTEGKVPPQAKSEDRQQRRASASTADEVSYAVSVDIRLTPADIALFDPKEFSDIMIAMCKVMRVQAAEAVA